MTEQTKKFYEQVWFAWLMVVVFFPVGLYLMFNYQHHNKTLRIILTVVLSVAVLAAIVDGDDDVASGDDDNNEAEVVENDDENDAAEEDSEPASNEDNGNNNEVVEDVVEEEEEEVVDEGPEAFDSGMYKVGADLEPGEYLVFSDSSAYVEVSSSSEGGLDSIVSNMNLGGGEHAYVTVNDGEYLTVDRGHFYPVEDAPSVVPEDGVYEDGMYLVGVDIPAGEYRVQKVTGNTYLEVASDSRHGLSSIVTNDLPSGDSYITVSEGQYLSLSGLMIDTN